MDLDEEKLLVRAILDGLKARSLILEEFPRGKLALTPLFLRFLTDLSKNR